MLPYSSRAFFLTLHPLRSAQHREPEGGTRTVRPKVINLPHVSPDTTNSGKLERCRRFPLGLISKSRNNPIAKPASPPTPSSSHRSRRGVPLCTPGSEVMMDRSFDFFHPNPIFRMRRKGILRSR